MKFKMMKTFVVGGISLQYMLYYNQGCPLEPSKVCRNVLLTKTRCVDTCPPAAPAAGWLKTPATHRSQLILSTTTY